MLTFIINTNKCGYMQYFVSQDQGIRFIINFYRTKQAKDNETWVKELNVTRTGQNLIKKYEVAYFVFDRSFFHRIVRSRYDEAHLKMLGWPDHGSNFLHDLYRWQSKVYRKGATVVQISQKGPNVPGSP